MSDSAPLILAFRRCTGCRQYPFESLDALIAWAERKPYSQESLRVQIYGRDRRLAADSGYAAAATVAAFAVENGRSLFLPVTIGESEPSATGPCPAAGRMDARSYYHRGDNPFTEQAPPSTPGKGYVFIRVGQLIRPGDEFWSEKLKRWVPAERVFKAVAACFKNRYRRKAE